MCHIDAASCKLKKLKNDIAFTGMEIQELNGTELPLSDVFLTFDEFCCIVAEFKNQRLESRRLWDVFTHSVVSPIQKVFGKLKYLYKWKYF